MGAGASIQVSKDKIQDLSVEEVGGLLKQLGFPQYVEGVSKMGVDGHMLGDLDDAKIKQIIPNVRLTVFDVLLSPQASQWCY